MEVKIKGSKFLERVLEESAAKLKISVEKALKNLACPCHLGSVCNEACAKGKHHGGCPNKNK